jgi:hypothetical protein
VSHSGVQHSGSISRQFISYNLIVLTFLALLQATDPRRTDSAIGRAQLVCTLPSFSLKRLIIWPS